LVSKTPSSTDIVLENGAYCKKMDRNFTNAVLGYVTPVSKMNKAMKLYV
jgi:hypothetical protein